MIYLKQVKLLDPDLVAGDPEELKYPYKAPAVRFTESFIFRKPVTFLVGENGAGKSTLLEAMMSKYEERDEEEPGKLYDGTEASPAGRRTAAGGRRTRGKHSRSCRCPP